MSTLSQHGRVTREEIAHLAHLARLAVTDEELDLFAGQLAAVLDAVAQVGKAAAEDVTPTTHAVPMTNVTRADVARPSLPGTSSSAARRRPRTTASASRGSSGRRHEQPR